MVLVAIGAVVALSGGSNDNAGASEGVQRELATSAGTNPFMPSVAAEPPASTAPTTTLPPTNGTVSSFNGSTPGLYGGTLNNKVCDVQQLVDFLTQNGQKGAAWAERPGHPAIGHPDVRRDTHAVASPRPMYA